MLISRLNIPCFYFSKIIKSLKLLQLTPPTTKKDIKSKYFELAKQLHPDIKQQEQSKKTAQQLKKDSEAFIEITQAYKYLSELSETQINSPDQYQAQIRSKRDEKGDNEQEQMYRPMSQEEKMRRSTEAYFNKRYRKSRRDEEDEEMKKEPLYKQVPELFIGFFFVFAFICQWAYAAYQRSRRSTALKSGEANPDTFKSLNFKKKYNKPIDMEQGIEN